MSRPVRLVSACSSCFVLSRGVRPVSSCVFLFRYFRLCLVMSALSGLVRPFSSCPSCLVPFVWSRSVLVRVVRLVLSYPSRVLLAVILLLLILSVLWGVVPLCFLSRPDRLCLLSRHIRFVSSCPFCLKMLVCLMEQINVCGFLVVSANVGTIHVSNFMNPNHDFPNTQSRPTSCKTEDYFLSCLQFCHAYNLILCMTANVGR